MNKKSFFITVIVIILAVFILSLLFILNLKKQNDISFLENLYTQRLEAMDRGDVEKFNSLTSQRILQTQREYLKQNPEIILSDYLKKQYEISKNPVLEKLKLINYELTESTATLEYKGSEPNEAVEGGILYIRLVISFVKEESGWKIDEDSAHYGDD